MDSAVPASVRLAEALRRRNGRFAPGVSGNPGGRPAGLAELQRQASGLASAAIFALVRICCDAHAPPAQQVAAASLLLRWGFGRAPLAGGRDGRARWATLDPTLRRLLAELRREEGSISVPES